jgi:hypothetical protein
MNHSVFLNRQILRAKICRILFYMIATAALLIFAGCSPKQPEAPRWDTQWDIPLTNKTYNIQDMLDELDEDNLLIDSTGAPRFEFTEGIDTFEVGDNLTAPTSNTTFAEELGIVEIDAPPGETIETPLTDFLTVNFGIVPASSFSFDENMEEFEEFTWATVESGKLYLEVSNNLKVEITSLSIDVIDTYDNSVLGTIAFAGGLAIDETKRDSINLAENTIRNQLKLSVSGTNAMADISGYSLDQLSLESRSGFSENFNISAANAKIPQIEKEFSEELLTTDSSVIDSALIQAGFITIAINNKTNMAANIIVTVTSLTQSNGIPLTMTGTVNGGQQGQITRSLVDYNISPQGTSYPQAIPVEVDATIQSSGETLLDVDQYDSIIVQSDLSELDFTTIKGKIKPTDVEVDPTSMEIEIPDGLEHATLTNAYMYLNFYNSSEIDALLDLDIIGNNSKTLEINGTILGKTAGATTDRLTTITVGPDEMADFLDPPPDQIEITGIATFNPDFAQGTITRSDQVYGNLLISSPLAFTLADTAEIELDIESNEMSDDAPDFEERVHYAVVNADIRSHLPVGAEVSIYVSTIPDSTMYSDPSTVVIGPMYLNAASVDANGHAIEEAATSFTDSLTSDEVKIFDNDIVYIGKRVKMYTAQIGSDVEIQSTDYIVINATASTEIEFGGED